VRRWKKNAADLSIASMRATLAALLLTLDSWGFPAGCRALRYYGCATWQRPATAAFAARSWQCRVIDGYADGGWLCIAGREERSEAQVVGVLAYCVSLLLRDVLDPLLRRRIRSIWS